MLPGAGFSRFLICYSKQNSASTIQLCKSKKKFQVQPSAAYTLLKARDVACHSRFYVMNRTNDTLRYVELQINLEGF